MTDTKIILIDIDHSLADSFWRDSMLANGDWDAYHSESINDKPLKRNIDIINALAFGEPRFRIVALTSRPEKWRGITNKWLLDNGVEIDLLLMRPENNYGATPDVKLATAQQEFGSELKNVVAIFDNREDVLARFKAVGVNCFQVIARSE